MTDLQLLDRYTRERSQPALEELLRRHVAWVHAVAQRRLNDSHRADDVMQAVFLVLAQKPPRLKGDAAFGAWLFRVTCNSCNRAVRGELRRKKRERAFAMEHHEADDELSREMTEQEWRELSPHLDLAVQNLRREDREAILLRFYQQKSHADVAAAAGITEEAARKRVQRAVVKLREELSRAGVGVPVVGALVAGLGHFATPPVTAATIQLAMAATQGAAASAHAIWIAKGAIFMLGANKLSAIAAACVAAILVVGGTALVLIQSAPAVQTATAAPPSPATVPTTQNADDWRQRFDQVYRLNDAEVLKNIPPPFIPERLTYYQTTESKNQVQAIPLGPDNYTFRWTDGKLQDWGSSFGLRGLQPVSRILGSVLGFKTYEVDAPQAFLDFKIEGDWIVRNGITSSQRLDALCQSVKQLGGPALKFSQQIVTRPAMVASGRFEYHAPTGAPGRPQGAQVHFYRTDIELADSGGGGGAGPVHQMLERLGSYVNIPLIDETTGPLPEMVGYSDHLTGRLLQIPVGPERDAAVQTLLENVVKQTSLKLTIEPHDVPVWVAGP